MFGFIVVFLSFNHERYGVFKLKREHERKKIKMCFLKLSHVHGLDLVVLENCAQM